MKIFVAFLILFIYSFAVEVESPLELDIDISKFKVASLTDQIILVIPPNYTTTSAMLYFYVKEENQWKEYLQAEAYIGKNGLGKEKEGDCKTPVGVYQFNAYFGIKDNPGTNLPYVKVNVSHYWDGDSDSDRYNQMVNYETYKDFSTDESEHLIEIDPGYEYAMNINWNKEGIPKKGSAIFLHCFTRNKYTAGCVAIHYLNLAEIYRKINDNCYIIIDTKENMTRYYD
jgi:L,D-peptidoglycan transpeptidase YkuD (ErfK/YbiS/YcfS/YnhG family)